MYTNLNAITVSMDKITTKHKFVDSFMSTILPISGVIFDNLIHSLDLPI